MSRIINHSWPDVYGACRTYALCRVNLGDIERLALSPQCGFASVDAGNPLTPDEQAAKRLLVAQVARRMWAS